nr:MAG TPA: hypothetical protein [Caudoviricetes sp.]
MSMQIIHQRPEMTAHEKPKATTMSAIDASASKNVSKSGTCILLSFSFLIVDHKLVQCDLEILCELEQLRKAGPVNRALPLADCAVAQACRRLQIGAAQSVQLAKLVNF